MILNLNSFFCRHSTYGVQDDVSSGARMLEFRDFLQARGVPLPLVVAHLTVNAQFIASLLLLVGGAFRLLGLATDHQLYSSLLIAHIRQSFPQYYPAAQLITVGFFFLLNSAGTASVDTYIARSRKQQISRLADNEPTEFH